MLKVKQCWVPICILNQSIKNDLEVAYPLGRSSSSWYLVELEFGNAGFWGEGKTGVPGEKPLRAIKKGQQQTQPIYGVHASIGTLASLVAGECFTTAPSLFTPGPLRLRKCYLLGQNQGSEQIFPRKRSLGVPAKSLIWSFFSLKLRYPALYSIYSSGAGFIAACNYNYKLFLFNCQLRILWYSPYATTELFDELKVSAPLYLWALIFQWTAV